MKIIIIDNYDSFTYNLFQYLKEAAPEATVDVLRNDKFELEQLSGYDAIVLSPGPGLPSEAGHLLALIGRYAQTKPILGICLGHQAIAEAFGAKLRQLKKVYHGLKSEIFIKDIPTPILQGLGNKIEVGRYHSWVVDTASVPDIINILAEDEEGQIMALQHQTLPVFGLQFHPESVLTLSGRQIIENFIQLIPAS